MKSSASTASTDNRLINLGKSQQRCQEYKYLTSCKGDHWYIYAVIGISKYSGSYLWSLTFFVSVCPEWVAVPASFSLLEFRTS